MKRILLMVFRNLWRVPWAYIKLCFYAKHTDEYPEEVKYRHIQYIFKRAVQSGNIDFRVYGKENIPEQDGFIIYGNHQGMFDILAVGASCDRPVAAILKKELKDIPFMKQIIACTKSFPMDREDIRQSMEVIVATTKEVMKGRNYLIFPEGTRSKKGNEMMEFHNGSFKCALKAKCPIIPMALIDCFKVMDQKNCKQVTVQVHYLEPIYYDEYKDMNTVQLAAMVRERIQDTIEKNKEKETC